MKVAHPRNTVTSHSNKLMNLLPILASIPAEAQPPGILDTLQYLSGMLMVLATLATLWGITVIVSKIIALFSPSAPAPVPVSAPAVKPEIAASAANDNRIAPEIIAVIAAAVASSAGAATRIISIKQKNSGWGKAGRQAVLSSHRIR